LRELGVLLTSIIVAGRSGSAFTAEIASMKLREEIDAMRVLGLDPIEVLVLPRTIALVIALPLLTFFSDIMALVGGAIMAWVTLGIGPEAFIERLRTISIWHAAVGLIKAPVFAGLIAIVGCHEGLMATASAESVGRQTTRAVVEAIFLVIVVDAVFSIVFNLIRI
jgi:phospholipid/cholesterol/gamma-HCH transport system permease protein